MSEGMVEARKLTFGKWWPHEKKKGWGPKVDKVRPDKFLNSSYYDDMWGKKRKKNEQLGVYVWKSANDMGRGVLVGGSGIPLCAYDGLG